MVFAVSFPHCTCAGRFSELHENMICLSLHDDQQLNKVSIKSKDFLLVVASQSLDWGMQIITNEIMFLHLLTKVDVLIEWATNCEFGILLMASDLSLESISRSTIARKNNTPLINWKIKQITF